MEIKMDLLLTSKYNNWNVHYLNGKPMLYIICASVPNSKL